MTNGIAYAAIHCRKTKDIINESLNSLKKAAKTPINLEMSLMDKNDLLKEDSDLEEFIERADISDLNYFFKAVYPNNSNEETAIELSHILMQANQSYLDEEGELWGVVTYKNQKNKYVLLR